MEPDREAACGCVRRRSAKTEFQSSEGILTNPRSNTARRVRGLMMLVMPRTFLPPEEYGDAPAAAGAAHLSRER